MPLKDKHRRKEYNTAYYMANRKRILAKESEWRMRNPEKALAQDTIYRSANREKLIAYDTYYRTVNRDRMNAASLQWKKDNKHRCNANNAKRRAMRIKSTPAWADQEIIGNMYIEAEYQNMEVDHIVPLLNSNVCGLHWEGNLQLLTMKQNRSKGNRFHD